MAGDTVFGRRTDHPEAANEKLRQQFNRLCDAVDALLEKLDADEGVNDSDYVDTIGGMYSKVEKK